MVARLRALARVRQRATDDGIRSGATLLMLDTVDAMTEEDLGLALIVACSTTEDADQGR